MSQKDYQCKCSNPKCGHVFVCHDVAAVCPKCKVPTLNCKKI